MRVMILPNPAGWQRIAREIAREVSGDLGDLLFVIEPWIEEMGAPAPSELYDENALLATGALVVNAARAGLALREGHPELGGPLRKAELLEPALAKVLLLSLKDVPSRCRRFLPVREPRAIIRRAAGPAVTGTLEYVARVAALAISK